MTNEDLRRSALMAQLSKKRALKEKYLRPGQGPRLPLTDLVMTNAMLLAIRDRVDLFGLIRRICLESPETADLDGAMGWIQALSDGLGCSPYELFLDDRAKRRRLVEQLLAGLTSCTGWENVRENGFALPGFDYAWRMSDRPQATLIFEVGEQGYVLALAGPSGPNQPIPGQAVLWQEAKGPLQAFVDRVLEENHGPWREVKPRFDALCSRVRAQGETLRDLGIVLEQMPGGAGVDALLERQRQTLESLRQEMEGLYRVLPEAIRNSGRGQRVQNALILLGGAVKTLEKLPQQGWKEALDEVVYLLENAGQPL